MFHYNNFQNCLVFLKRNHCTCTAIATVWPSNNPFSARLVIHGLHVGDAGLPHCCYKQFHGDFARTQQPKRGTRDQNKTSPVCRHHGVRLCLEISVLRNCAWKRLRPGADVQGKVTDTDPQGTPPTFAALPLPCSG